MSNYSSLKSAIDANIKANGRREITGPVLNAILNAVVNSLGDGYLFRGVAIPSTNPGTPDQNVAYLAITEGTYTHMGGLSVTDGELSVFSYNGAWSKIPLALVPTKTSQLDNDLRFVTSEEMGESLSSKQDTIQDLETIRSGAAAGATAYQKPSAGIPASDMSSAVQNSLQLAENSDHRPYNSSNPDGMGYLVLKKNKTFAEQVTEENTIYEIRYDFSLDGETITIPNGSVLKFEGGKVSNGTLSGTFNVVSQGVCFYEVGFDSAILDTVSLSWFDVQANVPCNDIFNSAFAIKCKTINIPSYDFPILVEAPNSASELGIFSCIRIKEGEKVIDFNNNTIKLQATSNGACKIVSVECENATIKNLNIVGDVSSHTGATGESAHGLSLIVCSNVTLENINVSECWGDGICFVDVEINGTGYYPHNIFMSNCKSLRNRRNALSIEAGRELKFNGCEFAYTGEIVGTSPSAGLDIEPWHDVTIAKVDGVTFTDCSFHDNSGNGEVILSKASAFTNATIDNITFDNCDIFHSITGGATHLMHATNVGTLNIVGGVYGTSNKNGFVNVTATSFFADSALFYGRLYANAESVKISKTNILLCDTSAPSKKALSLDNVTGAKIIDSNITALIGTCLNISSSIVDFDGCNLYDSNSSTADNNRFLLYASVVSMVSCSLRLGSAISLNAFANENHHFSVKDSKWEKMAIGASAMFINNLKSHIATYTYDVEIENTDLFCKSGQVFSRGSDSNDVKIYIEKFPIDSSIINYNEYRLLPTNDADGDFPVINAGTIVMRDYVQNHLTQYQVGFKFFDKTLNKPLFWNGVNFVDANGNVFNTQKTAISGWTLGKVIYCNQGIGNAYDTTPKGLQGARYVIIPVVQGNVYVINGQGGNSPRLWCFADANNIILSVAEVYAETHLDYLVIVPPTGATQLIINNYSGYTEDCYELVP